MPLVEILGKNEAAKGDPHLLHRRVRKWGVGEVDSGVQRPSTQIVLIKVLRPTPS